MDDRILIWGAGAIGGTLGAAFVRAGKAVVFVDTVPEHVTAINAHGLRVGTRPPLLPGTKAQP